MVYETAELTNEFENIISNSILDNYPYSWDEDTITLNLLRDLRKKLSSIKMEEKETNHNITWQIYKLKGTYETKYGDISLVINKHYKDGTYLEGVAFLEAKRRDTRKTTFSAMNKLQLNRILSNAPHAQYLLYDYENITNFQINSQLFSNAEHYHHRHHYNIHTQKTNAVCTPMNIAKSTGYKDTLLYKHSTPFSVMLTERYFQGLDLEFDDKSKKVATGFLTKFGLPKFILEIKIRESDERVSDENMPVNKDMYELIN